MVSARELNLREIREIRDNIPEDMEIETFVHGAMCISYSGRCLLSSFMAGRDANKGACTHPCRWKYAVVEESRPGQYMPIEENDRGTYIFNSKDLCMIEHIPELVEAGIDSFKIEGRMKTALYVATVGFFFGKPDEEAQIYDKNEYEKDSVYLGIVEDVKDNVIELTQKNKFKVNDEIEIMKKDGQDIKTKVLGIKDEKGNEMDSCPHPQQKIFVELSEAPDVGDILKM